MKKEKCRQGNQCPDANNVANPFAPITSFHHNELNKIQKQPSGIDGYENST